MEKAVLHAQTSEEESPVAAAILDYLAEHPQAMDTLEGIAEWWLARQRVRIEVRAVASALQQLTEQGLLEEVGSGESRCYRLKSK